VIIGKLIPAGSGFVQRRRDQLARQQAASGQLPSVPAVASVGAAPGGGVSTLEAVLDSLDNE
jgi:DNA-directed RNA polymerase subunit beta'